jgi:hypothetical protein
MLRYLLSGLICSLILFSSDLSAQGNRAPLPPTLSADAVVSVVTCSPGTEIYELFGHSAFRVRDPQTGLDQAYNYGTFEFGPDFVMLFLRGKLRYLLNSYSFRRFQAEYVGYNRSIKEQVLNLDLPERQAVYDYLNTNELPENKYYQYDFFYDNCATRERDVLKSVLGDRLRFIEPAEDTIGSLRDMIHLGFEVTPWVSFGCDIALGLPTDADADLQMSMFLPDYLFEALRVGEVKNSGQYQPLVKREVEIFKRAPGGELEAGFFTPVMACWLLFAIGFGLTMTGFGRSRIFRLFDTLVFFVIGILGVVMLLFWFGTDHQATYQNLNLLWAIPTHIGFAFLIWFRSLERKLAKYAGFFAIYYLVWIACSWMLPQYVHPAFYPLVLLMFMRLMLYRFQSMN